MQRLLKPSEPCHVGIYWKALAEHFQMSTHVPGFQSFRRCFASFCISQISHQQHIRVKGPRANAEKCSRIQITLAPKDNNIIKWTCILFDIIKTRLFTKYE